MIVFMSPPFYMDIHDSFHIAIFLYGHPCLILEDQPKETIKMLWNGEISGIESLPV